jgi:hypothetical protein
MPEATWPVPAAAPQQQQEQQQQHDEQQQLSMCAAALYIYRDACVPVYLVFALNKLKKTSENACSKTLLKIGRITVFH